MKAPDFARSCFRFYMDFEQNRALSLSHRPPTRTNRVRVALESVCRLTHGPSDRTTTYALAAACRTEQVGAARNELWIQPNAECTFLCSDDGQVSIHKSWHKNDPGVMLCPASLGPQPERQTFRAGENFDETTFDLLMVDATPLSDFDQVAEAILATQPIISRIEYTDGEFEVCIDQPVKTINLAERDRLHQTDTGPIILPDLSPERLEQASLEIDVFDLAYSAWHAPDWAEFVIRTPTELDEGVSANHYSQTRHVEPTRNTLLVESS